ncbi:hypothetical protein CLOSTASPAR_02231 [[Clostridium] asparagiforme DSM 15981]|uniref:Uncharacterized protein n=1 Tax=[Clostridium] asparagiforme DSM 15981 TaxID=518636 RepID=C0CZ04_9FIRM|nr:hypothetical protein CLOSTASPAR_02231 [[Clostridium] asparagiforme DSM 15981]
MIQIKSKTESSRNFREFSFFNETFDEFRMLMQFHCLPKIDKLQPRW